MTEGSSSKEEESKWVGDKGYVTQITTNKVQTPVRVERENTHP